MTTEHAEPLGEDSGDVLADALDRVVGVLRDLGERAEEMITQANALTAVRREGTQWEQILSGNSARSLTVALDDSAQALRLANSQVRRAQAGVLYSRGLSMERIGALLGISRQRVAVLLKNADEQRTAPH